MWVVHMFGGPEAWDRKAAKLVERFLATGDVTALERAIDLLRRAVQATPATPSDRAQRVVRTDRDRARLLSNLGGHCWSGSAGPDSFPTWMRVSSFCARPSPSRPPTTPCGLVS